MDIEGRVLSRLVSVQAEESCEVQGEKCYQRVYVALHVVAPGYARTLGWAAAERAAGTGVDSSSRRACELDGVFDGRGELRGRPDYRLHG